MKRAAYHYTDIMAALPEAQPSYPTALMSLGKEMQSKGAVRLLIAERRVSGRLS